MAFSTLAPVYYENIQSFLLVRLSDPFLSLDQAASGQISSVDGQDSIPYLNRSVSADRKNKAQIE